MRREPTEAERVLWRLLRRRQLAHLKIRRQAPIGPYTVDFVCFERRFIIEADGGQHAESAHDAKRDAWLTAQGFQILSFWNHEVRREPDSVLATILARLGLPW